MTTPSPTDDDLGLIGIGGERIQLTLPNAERDRLAAHRVAAPYERRLTLLRFHAASFADVSTPARRGRHGGRITINRKGESARRRKDGRDRRRLRLMLSLLRRRLALDGERILLLGS